MCTVINLLVTRSTVVEEPTDHVVNIERWVAVIGSVERGGVVSHLGGDFGFGGEEVKGLQVDGVQEWAHLAHVPVGCKKRKI